MFDSDEEAVFDSGEEDDQVVFDSDNSDDLEFESDGEEEEEAEESDNEESQPGEDSDEDTDPQPGPSKLKLVEIKTKDPKKPTTKPNNVKSSKNSLTNSSKSKRSTSTLKGNKIPSEITLPMSSAQDEYEYDSSDEEDIRNTVGNIPMHWYDEYNHIGYDWDGKKLIKPEKGDQLDAFLKRMEDPTFWRTVKDSLNGQGVILSEEDIELIMRIQKQRIPDAQFDEYAPWVEWFTSQVEKTPLRKFPEHKRSFLPSKPEAAKVSKLVHALKMGWIKSTAEMEKERQEKKTGPQFYMLWQADDQPEEMRRIHKHIPAPKRHLPGHAESYNPPPEYIFDKRELKQWNKLKSTPWKRKLHFLPQQFNSLREVPAYPRFIKERFQRCLDLYLCPRALKMKLTIEPEVLVPQLPSPKDLQPFPTTLSMVFKGHTNMVRSITAQPKGQYIASGSEDMTLKIWEISTGRCVKTIPCGGIIRSVAWCPNEAVSLIAVAADKKVLIINPGIGDHLVTSKTDRILEDLPVSDVIENERVKTAVQWEVADNESSQTGIRIVLNHFKLVTQVTWHPKGDYFATVMTDGQNRSVLINKLSNRRSQLPFNRSKGLIQCVLFHPIRPFLFVAVRLLFLKTIMPLIRDIFKFLLIICNFIFTDTTKRADIRST